MQGKQLFEYAVIRVMPRVDREEFLNVGVVLYCAGQKYLGTLYEIDIEKLRTFGPALNISEIETYLQGFKRIGEGQKNAGPIALLSLPERFRWLTATRSTVIQTSKVHPGFCNDAGEMLTRLFLQLVL